MVSPDSRNRFASDVIVVPLSTVIREAPTHVRLRAAEAGIRRQSVAKCEQITTVDRSLLSVRPIGGTLSGPRMTEIEKGILRAIGVPID